MVVHLSVSVELFDDHDEVVDGVGEDIEVAVGVVGDGDVLDMSADVGQVSGNVWGNTPGAVWGHALSVEP